MDQEKNLSRHSEKAIFEIPLKLPSLNEYTSACRSNAFKGSKMKKETEDSISLFLRRVPEFEGPVFIGFHWIEKDNRRDLDNIAFAKKFILDALVKKGKLKDDGRKYVKGFRDTFEKGPETKVIVTIEEVEI